MDGDNEWNTIISLRQNAAKMDVPGMAMNKVGIDIHSIEVGAALDGPENGTQRLRTSELVRIDLEPGDSELFFFKALIATTTHLYRHKPGQFARQISHMHTGAAV